MSSQGRNYEGFVMPLWVVLRTSRESAFRTRDGNQQSPLQYAIEGPQSYFDRPIPGSWALYEVLTRLVRRRPVLAVDFRDLAHSQMRRYRTSVHHISDWIPSPKCAIGYVRFIDGGLRVDGWTEQTANGRACNRIVRAAKRRDSVLAMKRNRDLRGIDREITVLLEETKGVL